MRGKPAATGQSDVADVNPTKHNAELRRIKKHCLYIHLGRFVNFALKLYVLSTSRLLTFYALIYVVSIVLQNNCL